MTTGCTKNGRAKVGGITGAGPGVATAHFECIPAQRFRGGKRGEGVEHVLGGGGGGAMGEVSRCTIRGGKVL